MAVWTRTAFQFSGTAIRVSRSMICVPGTGAGDVHCDLFFGVRMTGRDLEGVVIDPDAPIVRGCRDPRRQSATGVGNLEGPPAGLHAVRRQSDLVVHRHGDGSVGAQPNALGIVEILCGVPDHSRIGAGRRKVLSRRFVEARPGRRREAARVRPGHHAEVAFRCSACPTYQ